MKKNANDFCAMKGKERIAMLTAYTTPIARCLENAGISCILVGDTWGMVEMGFSSTRDVTMEHMLTHITAVRRGAPDTHIIGDMPYQSDNTPDLAVINAKRMIEAGADSIKLEGPKYDVIEKLVNHDIAVFGHTGLTPQTATNFKQVGKNQEDAQQIVDIAKRLEEVGCYAIILEHIPSDLGKQITEMISIPTVGIGAGPDCDGQVLVINDVLGLGDYWPPFSKQYLHMDQMVQEAASQFIQEVRDRQFPN